MRVEVLKADECELSLAPYAKGILRLTDKTGGETCLLTFGAEYQVLNMQDPNNPQAVLGFWRDDARQLAAILNHFADTGELKAVDDEG